FAGGAAPDLPGRLETVGGHVLGDLLHAQLSLFTRCPQVFGDQPGADRALRPGWSLHDTYEVYLWFRLAEDRESLVDDLLAEFRAVERDDDLVERRRRDLIAHADHHDWRARVVD